MKPDAYLPFYGKDFFDAVEAWDEITTLAYLRALWRYWSHEHCAGLPDDNDTLLRICRVDLKNWARVKGKIFNSDDRFFALKDGKWHQKRASEEYAKIAKAYNEAVERAARARQVNPDNNPNIRPEQNLTSGSENTLFNPYNQNQNQNHTKKKSTPLAALAEIEAIYKAFPLHVGKPAAFRAIRGAISRGNPPEALLEKAKLFAESRGGDMSFCPHPSTWFNQDRFNDDPETWKPKQEQQAQHAQHSQPQSAFALTKIIEAKTTLANNLKNKHAVEGPMNTEWDNENARQEYIKLRGEIKTVTAQLAKMA